MMAQLIYFESHRIAGKYIVELEIFEVYDLKRYPQGVKYGLIFIDLKSGFRLLMDNHYPKGPHIHINEVETEYEYFDSHRLIADFKALVEQQFGVRI